VVLACAYSNREWYNPSSCVTSPLHKTPQCRRRFIDIEASSDHSLAKPALPLVLSENFLFVATFRELTSGATIDALNSIVNVGLYCKCYRFPFFLIFLQYSIGPTTVRTSIFTNDLHNIEWFAVCYCYCYCFFILSFGVAPAFHLKISSTNSLARASTTGLPPLFIKVLIRLREKAHIML
jgi:hypothetical protein